MLIKVDFQQTSVGDIILDIVKYMLAWSGKNITPDIRQSCVGASNDAAETLETALNK